MIINRLDARIIKDTRGDKTIEVILKTDFGKFISSAPNGKSKGKFEANPYKNSINDDIKTVKKFTGNINFECFSDLINIEKNFRKKVGANTMIAVEYCFLKALAKKQKKEIWQLINPKAHNFPMPIGNAIGGGRHSSGVCPDFQEFWFVPRTKKFELAVKANKLAWKKCKDILKKRDNKFSKKLSDENAWKTSLSNEEVMKIMIKIKEEISKKFMIKVDCGIDMASSEFFSGGKYNYKNSRKKLNSKEQINHVIKIGKEFMFLEDPLEQRSFLDFSKLTKKTNSMIIGDDLCVTNLIRIKKAGKGIRGVIIKPNQNGSLIELGNIVEYCKKNKIKTIFSHRSGETSENILADIAFGFQADYIKTGICGKGRDEKLNRLIEIERSLR